MERHDLFITEMGKNRKDKEKKKNKTVYIQ